MQLAQSGSESTAPKEPASRVWPQRVVTGPVRGTLGVRWIRPPDLRRTDSRRTRCTPKSWGVELAQDRGPVFPCQATSNLPPKIWAETHLQIEPARPNDNPPGRGAPVGAYVEPMSLLIVPARTTLRRQSLHLTEELDFDPRAVRRAVAALELRAGRAHTLGLSIRVDLHGLKVADVRRALAGLPSPGDYRVVIKPLRYRTKPSLSGLCEFDLGRIIIRVPEPFRPFDEHVYVQARRKP